MRSPAPARATLPLLTGSHPMSEHMRLIPAPCPPQEMEALRRQNAALTSESVKMKQIVGQMYASEAEEAALAAQYASLYAEVLAGLEEGRVRDAALMPRLYELLLKLGDKDLQSVYAQMTQLLLDDSGQVSPKVRRRALRGHAPPARLACQWLPSSPVLSRACHALRTPALALAPPGAEPSPALPLSRPACPAPPSCAAWPRASASGSAR